MGCNSSSVVPLGDSDIEDSSGIKVRVNPSTPEKKANSPSKKAAKRKFFSRRSNQPPLESSEPPVETLDKEDFNMLSPHRVPRAPPLAFEVPVHENEESIIKKHPPKRFRKLEEQQQDPKDLTHQLIDERISEAEARRREILDQRIRSAAKQRVPLDRKFLRSEAFSQESEEADWEKNM